MLLPTLPSRPPSLALALPPPPPARVPTRASADVPERISSALVAAAIALAATIATPCGALAAGEGGSIATTSSSSPTTSATTATTTTSFASTPYTDLSNSIDYGLTRDGRVRPCPGAIPNCVSTSSTTDRYAPALRAEATTPAQAAELLDAAVAASLKGSEKIFQGAASRGAGLEGIFLQYEVPGASGRVRGPAGQPTKDVVEVLLRPETTTTTTSGKEEGESSNVVDTVVTYRSVADPDSIRFLPLLQQPLTDGGAQKARMRALLVERLGWRAIGCDTLDCVME